MNDEISAVGRDAQLAMLLPARWQEEIEQAISHVKKSLARSEYGRWFRRQWFRTQMRDRKHKGRVAAKKSNATLRR